MHQKYTVEIEGKQVAVELCRRVPKVLPITGYRLDTIEAMTSFDKVIDWARVWGERRTQANGHGSKVECTAFRHETASCSITRAERPINTEPERRPLDTEPIVAPVPVAPAITPDEKTKKGSAGNTPRQIALDLIARKIAPVPVPHGAKNPVIKKWQLLQITEADVPRYFPGHCNVGALMGPASRGLTDVDLDCKEAVALAGFFLPATGSKYGRPGKRTSHYLYTCNDPDPKAWIKWMDEKKACIVELRLGGGGKGSRA